MDAEQDPDQITIPGAPAPVPPELAEPTEPRKPLPPKPDQGAPEARTPT